MDEFDLNDISDSMLVNAFKHDNYEVIDTGVDSDLCYIFFSSNGLYYPNTRETFREQIEIKNRFEWKWIVSKSNISKKASRIIYVRDIYKCWYSYGINEKYNSIDKTIDLLRELSIGKEVVTVGSSAGGYMAVLTAIKLDAIYCLNFSGQYVIDKTGNNTYIDLSEFIGKYKGKIYYFLPAFNESDKKQSEYIIHFDNVKCLYFNDDKHASTMLTGNMPYIINKDCKSLDNLYCKWKGKKINKYFFLLLTVPFYIFVSVMKKEVIEFLKRRMGKFSNGL